MRSRLYPCPPSQPLPALPALARPPSPEGSIMNPLSRIAGLAVDRVLGLPSGNGSYVLRANVAVPMPDGVALLGDHYRPAGNDRPLPVVLLRSPFGRAGLAGYLFAA